MHGTGGKAMSRSDVYLCMRYKEALVVKHALQLKAKTDGDKIAATLAIRMQGQIDRFHEVMRCPCAMNRRDWRG